MKNKFKMSRKIVVLFAALLFAGSAAGCAQPLVRPSAPVSAEQTTENEPATSPVSQTDTQSPETKPSPEPVGSDTQASVTTTASPVQTKEVTGGGEIDLSHGGKGDPVPAGEYAPAALMYHLILEEPYTSLTNLFVRPSEFEDHLQRLSGADCLFLFVDEYANTDKRSVILTFDDGYEDNYTEMFPILKKYGAKATIFMITGKVNAPGYLTDTMIREMADSGLVRFESHTVNHMSLTSLNAAGLEGEFAGSAQTLYTLTGRYPTAVCYPGGTVNDFVKREASKYYKFGFTTVNSADTAGCDPMAIPRVRVSRGMSGGAILSRLGW